MLFREVGFLRPDIARQPCRYRWASTWHGFSNLRYACSYKADEVRSPSEPRPNDPQILADRPWIVIRPPKLGL